MSTKKAVATKEEVEALKYRLKLFQDREREIESQTERLDYIETKLKSAGSPNLSDIPKSPNGPQDRIGSMVAQMIDIKNDIQYMVEKQQEERHRLEELTAVLPANEKAVMRMKYIDGASWNEITDMLFGGKDDFLEKEDSYSQRTYAWHRAALEKLAALGVNE